MLESALQFAAHYVPIFPVRVWYEANRWRKKPHIKDWARRASCSGAQIEEWWREFPSAVVGVPLARVGLICLDADRHGGPDGVAALCQIPLPMHPIVTTKSGGEHHFFSQCKPPLRWERWAGGEVLGEGRFVVGYSIAPFITDAPKWPEWLLAELPKRDLGRNNASTTHMLPFTSKPIPLFITQSVPIRSKYLLREIERAERTNRNNMLHWASCRFGNMIGEGKFRSKENAEKLLAEAAKVSGVWSEDGEAACLATIRSGLETGIEEWRVRGRMCVVHGSGRASGG
jgi:hypothetical protein